MTYYRNSTTWAALALALAATAFAQTAPAPSTTSKPEETIKLEAFSVTGSNIKRLDYEKVLPITILGTSEIEIRDASQPSDLLTALPQVTGLPGNETATLGATARGDNASRTDVAAQSVRISAQ
jgi:outer membrane receptor protein involved in Fe transport